MSRIDVTEMEELLRVANRRDTLCKLRKCCPECGSEQVQLTSWFLAPAKWKCRMCRHKFEYEPFIPDPV